jgi:hypothetical protein
LTIIGTLLSDIMYAVVDPRVKLTGGKWWWKIKMMESENWALIIRR